MDDIVVLGFQQRVGDLEHIGQKALEALAIVALSYKYRIGKDGQAPYEYAQDILDDLGVDLEISLPHLEQAMQHSGWPKD